MEAVIIAGGKGTRLFPHIGNTPKALVKIGNRPIIEHQIILLREYGIKKVWLLLGHLGEQIKNYLGDGKKWKIKINYIQEEKPLGTAGALKQLEKKIRKKFLVFSGDIMLDMDLGKLIKFHYAKKDSLATFVVHPNDHPFDSDLVETDKYGKIIFLHKRPHPEKLNFKNLSIASVYIFSPKIFKYIPPEEKTDIEKYLLPKTLKSNGKIYTYSTPEYIKDAGTPERLEKVRKDYLSGRIKRLNLKNKRRAIFLDRDGVINKEVDQLSDIGKLKVYPFAAEAIKKINESDFLAIVITNQPMIAKGFMTEEQLFEIHKKIETELGLKGAKIDGIYYCPHHPDKGFKGEVPRLKIKCNCRKPSAGLILRAQKDFNIDLKRSYFIGDQEIDILAGKKAECKTILVKTGYGNRRNLFKIKPDHIAGNLKEAVKTIIS